MRTLVIGDIHGCLRALDLLLDTVQPQAADLLITLGDYVDRGPDSRGVLDRLIELQSRCQLVTLRGNHEIMMLDARYDFLAFDSWVGYGGKQTLQSYGVEARWNLLGGAVPPVHWRFLRETQPFFETETHFFVHANAYADIPLTEQPDLMLYWESINPMLARPHSSGKTMICGHTSQRSGQPLHLGFATCIDTWVYGNGWLTCLDVATGQYLQANQQGDSRIGCIGNR